MAGLFDDLSAGKYQKVARGLLGPAYEPLAALPGLLGEFTLGADVRDYQTYGSEAVRKALRGDYGQAGSDALWAAASLAGVALPGHASMADPRRYKGAAPDRTTGTVERHIAPKGTSARLTNLLGQFRTDKKLKKSLMDVVKRGVKRGGLDWYNTEELRDRFIAELGEKAGDAEWKRYMTLMGPTSPNQAVQPNLRTASFWHTQSEPAMKKRLAEFERGEMVPPKGSGYGSQTQRYQSALLGKFFEHGPEGFLHDLPGKVAPKPRGFAQSLRGNPINMAADKHFTRLMAMQAGNPDWLHGSATIAHRLVDSLKKDFPGVEKYIRMRKVSGKDVPSFNAKKAARELPNGDALVRRLRNEPTVWEDLPGENEYAAFEQYMGELAEEMGMTTPQLQAAFWVGAAEKTGVRGGSLNTFMNIFNENLEKQAKKRGMTPDELFKKFARRKEALVVPLAAVGTGGLLASQQDREGRNGLLY